MALITRIIENRNGACHEISVTMSRHSLEKRRWRTTATDGTDIAVDLEFPCSDGDVVLLSGQNAYVVRQTEEPVIEIPLPDSPVESAKMGWFLGNQHLQVEVTGDSILIARDPNLEAKLEKMGIHYSTGVARFSPDPHSRVAHHH